MATSNLFVQVLVFTLVDCVNAKGDYSGRRSGWSSPSSSRSSGGGGYYHTSGSSYMANNYHSPSACQSGTYLDGTDCRETNPEVMVIALIGGILVAVILVGLGHLYQQYLWNLGIQRKERDILQDAAAASKNGDRALGDVMPEMVTFLASYIDSNLAAGKMTVTCTGTLEFQYVTDQNSARTITGTGTDRDGKFRIKQGKLSPSGSCYWVEEIAGSNRQVLVTGAIVPVHEEGHLEFRGEWRANNGASGRFTTFYFTPKVYFQTLGDYTVPALDVKSLPSTQSQQTTT